VKAAVGASGALPRGIPRFDHFSQRNPFPAPAAIERTQPFLDIDRFAD
jgi:hypothetical protein